MKKRDGRERKEEENHLVHNYPDTIANHWQHSVVVDVVAVAVLPDH